MHRSGLISSQNRSLPVSASKYLASLATGDISYADTTGPLDARPTVAARVVTIAFLCLITQAVKIIVII